MTNEEIRNLLMLEIVAPEQDDKMLTDEERDGIYNRYKEGNNDWDYIFEQVNNPNTKQKLITLFREVD